MSNNFLAFPYFPDEHNTHVQATAINSVHFYFDCPFCNGEHQHGSCADFKNRVTSRSSHCEKWRGNFEIHINDKTKRFKQ